MSKLYFFIAAIFIYGMYAVLPFFVQNSLLHYILGAILSILASICWVSISRIVPQNELIINGAIFDTILTMMFLITPLFITGFNLNAKQTIGIFFMLLGMGLVKF